MFEANGYTQNIEKIFDVILAFNSVANYESLLHVILIKMMEITHSDAGTLYILEDDKLHFRITRNISMNSFKSADEIDLPPIILDKDNIVNICAYTAIKNEIVVIGDVYTDERFNFQGPKNYDKITGYKTASMLTLPLAAQRGDRQEVLGVIQLLNATDPATGSIIPYGDIFNPPVLPALSNIAAQTLENLMHSTEIRGLLRSFVEVLSRAIDERSAYNKRHTQNVARHCENFAIYLRERFPASHPYYFDENRLEQLTIAALLHDIGKIVTPLEVMDKADRLGRRLEFVQYRFEIKKCQMENEMLKGVITEGEYADRLAGLENTVAFIKEANTAGFLDDDKLAGVKKLAEITYTDSQGAEVPVLDEGDLKALSIQRGTLTGEERAIMQDHAAATGRLLDSVTFWKYYKDVPAWAGNHHEFLDGSGYPKGLRGEELSIGSCIITIMDIFEALTAKDRPYKNAMPTGLALSIIENMTLEGKLHGELYGLFKDYVLERVR